MSVTTITTTKIYGRESRANGAENKQTLNKHNTYPQGNKEIYSKHGKGTDVSKEKLVRDIGCETM